MVTHPNHSRRGRRQHRWIRPIQSFQMDIFWAQRPNLRQLGQKNTKKNWSDGVADQHRQVWVREGTNICFLLCPSGRPMGRGEVYAEGADKPPIPPICNCNSKETAGFPCIHLIKQYEGGGERALSLHYSINIGIYTA